MYRVTKTILVEGIRHEAGAVLQSTDPGTIKAMLGAGQIVEVNEGDEARSVPAADAIELALQLQSEEFQRYHDATVAELKEAHARELQAKEDKHAEDLAAAEDRHVETLKVVAETHADALKKLESDHKAALEAAAKPAKEKPSKADK